MSHGPKPANLIELIDRSGSAALDKDAMITGDRRVSFGELSERSKRMAALLIESGVGTSSTVALCLERAPELIISVLGIVRAGAA